MKTLIFTLEYKPFNGGVAEYYSALFNYWPNQNLYVLTERSSVEISDDSRIIRKKLISPIFSWFSSLFILARIIKKEKISHIIVGHILPLGTVVYILSFLFKFDYTLVLHGMDFSFSQKTKRKADISYRILKKSNNIICGNSFLSKQISNKYSDLSDKISIVNPGVDIRPIKGLKNNQNDIFNIFFIGRLVKRKGIDRVIEALSLIDEKKFSNINFLIAGSGPEEEYLKRLGNDKRIKFLGKISDEEKWKYLEESDLFVMPSRNINGDYEGFGIVYLEANLMETTILATNSGGVGDAVEDGVGAILMNSDNPKKIAEEIINLYYNKEKNKILGKRGRERVLKKFLWKKQVNKFFNIINK